MYFEGYGYDPSMGMVDLTTQQPGLQPGLIQRMKEGRHEKRGGSPAICPLSVLYRVPF